MHIKIVHDPATHVTWAVRLLSHGDRYGRNDSLVVDGEPLVEFFDTRHPHTDLGQFVSRYHAESLLERAPHIGLCLDAGTPTWQLSAEACDQVRAWLERHAATAVA